MKNTYLQMEEQVYWVKGGFNSCIYDLRESFCRIYHLDREATLLLEKLIESSGNALNINYEENEFIVSLKSKGLVSVASQWDGYFTLPDYAKSTWAPGIKRALVEVTTQCNLKCIHCYTGSIKNNNSISIAEFPLIYETLSALDINSVSLIGGEPLIYKNEVKYFISNMPNKSKKHIEIFTNGILLDSDMVSFCADNDVLIAISVYGTKEQHYKDITGMPKLLYIHQKLIQLLKIHNVAFRVCLVKMYCNDDVTVEDICNTFDIDSCRYDIVRPAGRAAETNLLGDRLKFERMITKEFFSRPIRRERILRNARAHSCFQDKLYITSELNVYPCAMGRQFRIGHLMDKDFVSKVNSRDSILSMSKDAINECNLCEYRYACFDCRQNSPKFDFFGKPDNCSYRPEIGVWENCN